MTIKNIKKILPFLLLVFILLIIPISFTKREDSDKNHDEIEYMNNQDIFNADLEVPTDGADTEVFYLMSDLYEIVREGIELVANETKIVKEAKDLEIASDITSLVGSKRIAISSADDLYKFGNIQSINFNRQGGTNTFVFRKTIEKVLSLDYALLKDIDYSSKRAQKFVPIGTTIYIDQGTEGEDNDDIKESFSFKGTFDGNGYEIRNLYLAESSYLSTTYLEEGESSAITVSTVKHYAMFSVIGPGAVVKNFILRNPSYELMIMDDSVGIFKFASLVGENSGTIYNVAVIDKKTNQQNADISGISFSIFNPSNQLASAAGFVHTNKGIIKNSYFVGKNIIVPSSIFRFNEVAPFVHSNEGVIEGATFEENSIVKPQSFNPGNIVNNTEDEIKNGNNVNINNSDTGDARVWNFYAQDGYPSLIGLNYDYVNGAFEINNDYDFISFSKLINFQTVKHGKSFDEHTYVLTKDINMRNHKGYVTPSKEFKGVLKGGEVDFSIGSTINTNKYIYNLEITTPYIVGNKYYLGMFSTVSGIVQNINFYRNEVKVINSEHDYGKTFYIGLVAGELKSHPSKSKIKNVITNSKIDLGEDPIGLTYAGGIVGLASGTLEFVANTGEVNGNNHDFKNNTISAQYYLGGIAGSNSGDIRIGYSMNKGSIKAVGSKNDSYTVTSAARTHAGGIIGEINNINQNTSNLFYLSNFGSIHGNSFIGKTAKAYQFVGGIFGNLKGYGLKLNEGNQVRNGGFENSGIINGEYVNSNTILYAAGIGVASTSENKAKVSYMNNYSDFSIAGFNYQTHNTNLFYAATIVDNSSNGIELSRAYNYQDYNFGSTYFDYKSSLSEPKEIKISTFFTSVSSASSKLWYVENKGDLVVGSTTSDSVVRKLLKVSNITQSTRVDYENVTNSGNIDVIRLNNTNDSIYVAGITWILPYVSRPYSMINVLNEGKIVTADIKGSTTIAGTVVGTSFADNTFYGNLNVRNLYVGGIVNINVGEIKNAFNLASITSKYDTTISDIDGTANTFVGGIVTFNYNLVQDAANSGLIEYTNSNNTSVSNFAATKNISTTNDSIFGGISIAYTGGIVLGGIVGAFGDISGTELVNHAQNFINNLIPVSKVLDTTNNGDVYGKAKEYVRSGGILGVALSVELASGTYENKSDKANITAGPFTTAIIGSEDPVSKSELSNGLNYGNVYAVTQTIGDYGTSFGTGNGSNVANAMRPGINATAGGVIAYGLTVMTRMINHGVVAATDVAGGIIGATYILGGASQAQTPVTTVTINTAVHYGIIKAINKNYYSSFIYEVNENFDNTNKYYPKNDTDFLFAGTTTNDKARYQNGRRGFGGIFGRLQRGNYGTMRSTEFNNIMNMDPDIDMVGRVDSNLPGSLVYYRFFNGQANYYTAKINDTTPNALVGWHTSKVEKFDFSNATVEFTVRRSSNVYYVTNINVLSENNVKQVTEYTKVVMRPENTSVSTVTYNRERYIKDIIYTGNNSDTVYRVNSFGLETSHYGTISDNTSKTFTVNNYTRTVSYNTLSSGSTSDPPTNDALKYPVERVTDDQSDTAALYIFDPSFPLMEETNAEYIYAVKANALAERFQEGGTNEKSNGMYVLASSTGSLDGATLPTNINIVNLIKIKETSFKYIDLENIIVDNLDTDGTSAVNLMSNYESMYQLSFNNQAEILPEDSGQTPLIADLKLYDPSGNSPILTGGLIDYTPGNKSITYTLSDSAFSQNTFNYEVLENALSNNAIIAKANISDNELLAFRNDYENRANDLLDNTSRFKAQFSGSINSGGQAIFYITVYSQISIMDQNIFQLRDDYIETYKIIINRQSTVLTTNATISLDSTTTITENSISDNYVVDTNTYAIAPNGLLEVSFVGANSTVNGLIPLNHLIYVHRVLLVNDGTNDVIDSDYYEITITPKQVNGTFGFSVEFSDFLKSGTYKIEYSYYNNSSIRSISIQKRASTSYDIVDMDYEYFSYDLLGIDGQFTKRSDQEFETYIQFGYFFDGVQKTDQDLVLRVISGDISYLNDKYYKLSLNGLELLTIRIAPFANLNSAKIRYEYTEVGKLNYIITYNITNEIGNTRTTTHSILERDLGSKLVYLDDNLQNTDHFEITREALVSKIDVDFNFIDKTLYNNIILELYIKGVLYEFDIDEIYYGINDDTFLFYITSILDKGIGEYTFKLEREENLFFNLGSVLIEKIPGQSAYLLDIRFTRDDNDTIFEYPSIKATDEFANLNNNYDPRVFSDGIYYGNALGSIKYFKIDGKVSDTILEDYSPSFVLPHGAIIERYDQISSTWTSILEDDFSSNEDDSLRIIKYRVTSEDSSEQVIYFITVTDFRYTLTLKFKIFYELQDGTLVDASHLSSPVKNKIVMISSKNLKLDTIYSTTGPTVGGFPVGIGPNNILGINNQSSLYYSTNVNSSVIYRFGRNMTGAYNFNIITPIYSGSKTGQLTPGVRYSYEMYMVPRDVSDWKTSDYKLPYMRTIDISYSGLYYFLSSPSPNPITRELAIVIKSETQDKNWGLYDEYTSWD